MSAGGPPKRRSGRRSPVTVPPLSRVPRLAAAWLLLGLAGGACKSSTKEALVLLAVDVPDLPALASVRFSVAGRSDLPSRTVTQKLRPTLMFGYYLPGVNGSVQIVAEAIDSKDCTVGRGQIDVSGVVAGEKKGPLSMSITALASATCSSGDGGVDGASDAKMDAGPPEAPPPDAETFDERPEGPAQKARGAACATGAECGTGRCVDGVCCESGCDGTCESCAEEGQKGTCVAVSGDPRGATRPRCAGAGTACAGTCDGSNRTACTYPDEQIVCAQPKCEAGTASGVATCDHAGACRTPTAGTCASGMCESATKCAGGCGSGSAAAACPTTQFCNAGGACENKIANGMACNTDAHCQSGACIDGSCCSKPSCDACQACTGPGGTCVTIAGKDDPDSCTNDKTCDATGKCKSRPGKMCATADDCSTGNCVDKRCCVMAACGTCETCTGGGGACVSVTTGDDPDTCAGSSSCDVMGKCKALVGHDCGTSDDCLAGNCVDGVCCESACTGQCESCREPDKRGICVAVTGDPRGNRAKCAGAGTACGGMCDGNRTACTFPDSTVTCGDGACRDGVSTSAPRCDRAGGCHAGSPTPCMSNLCADSTTCSGGCVPVTAPCPSGQYCTAQRACKPTSPNGAMCAANVECQSGKCLDSHCCGMPDGCGPCEACTGANGTCEKVTGKDDPDSCNTDRTCDASGACKINPGESCQADADCSTNHCVDGRCCTKDRCGTCEACTGGGGACVRVTGVADDSCNPNQICDAAGACKAKQGAGCMAKEECITNYCVDGVCCESGCSGQCEACGETAAKGTCVAVSGAPRSVPFRSACAGPTTGQAAVCRGTCDGATRAVCSYTTGNDCGNGVCMNGVASPPPKCDGAGMCKPGMSGSCMSNLCLPDGMSCAGACGPANPCPSDQYCDITGACKPKIADGMGCSADGQCGHGHCVANVCCATACNTSTQTCATGTCVPLTFTLSVSAVSIGGGTGKITSSPITGGTPAQIDCGSTCATTVPVFTLVHLIATPASGFYFSSWGGACGGITATTCDVNVTAATTVTAKFTIANKMFVSSRTYSIPALGGFRGAENQCASMAQAAGLPGTFIPWLISDDVPIGELTSRLNNAPNGQARGWLRIDGKPFLDKYDTGITYYSPEIDELGNRLDDSQAQVVTNTGMTTLCDPGYTNSGKATSAHWSCCGNAACAGPLRIYCFQIDYSAVLTFPKAAGWYAFHSTSAGLDFSAGLANADGVCAAQASAAGLPGSYRAMLATTTASVASRFTSVPAGQQIVRPDGIVLASRASDLFAPGGMRLASTFTVGADGSFRENQVAIGVPFPTGSDLNTVGVAASTCNNWTSRSASQYCSIGIPSESDSFKFTFGGTNSAATCDDTGIGVYCLQYQP